MTAPLSVERAPRASGGPAALAVAANDVLRKAGGLRGRRLLRLANQSDGFACPGCAWPSPERPARYAVCESGVRAIVDELGPRRAGPQLFATYTIPELANRSDRWLSSQGRLTHPMIRRPASNSYEPIAWDEAIALVAGGLSATAATDRAGFYVSARVSNEAAFMVQQLARALGTPHLTTSTQLCHEGSRVAMQAVLGTRRGGVGLSDFEAAEAIFVFGQNPGSNHPRMLEALRAAKLRGAKIVAINPLREVGMVRVRDLRSASGWLGSGTEIADLHLSVRVGGDLALIAALAKATIEAGAVDREFLDARCEGFAELEASLAELEFAALARSCGVEESELRAAAKIYIESKATIACWGVGLTQHRRGTDTVEALLSLLLLRGNLGRPGAGPLPVLGHSNTAGCWTLGVGVPSEPVAPTGIHVLLDAMGRGELDVLLSLGGNLLSASPDTEAVAEGLRRCRLTVHVGTKLNRAHLITGETGLLLPCLGRSERPLETHAPWTSFEDASGRVHASLGPEDPIANTLLPEVEILARIGAGLEPSSGRPSEPPLDWRGLDWRSLDWRSLGRDYDQIRAAIVEQVRHRVDGGASDAAALAQLRPGHSVSLPSPLTSPEAPSEARAKLHIAPVQARHAPATLPDDQLWLTTIRSHDQHNSNIYWVGDRERGIHGYRRVLLMNLDDMGRLGIEPYTQVDLVSHFEGQTRHAPKWVAIPHHVEAGCAAAYWPEANVLVFGDAVDPRAGTPSLKAVAISLAPSPSQQREP